MDKLSMSLDQIIQQTETFKKVKHNDTKKGVVKSSANKDNRAVGKFENKKAQFQKSPIVKEVPERPMKIVTRERPKVITPESVHHTLQSATPSQSIAAVSTIANPTKGNHSSVFNRLGSSGTYVLFVFVKIEKANNS